MKNFVPLPYRQVAVRNRVDFPLTESGLRENLLGRDAYRRTEFIVLRGDGGCAVARITKARPDDLFSPVIAVELFASPHECHWSDDAAVDVGNPSQLAAKARALGVDCGETLIVHGKYEHVNFIYRPEPIVIRVVDVIPPEPAKLWTMVNQVLVIAEDLPPIELRYDPIDLIALARSSPAPEYLFPCQASGIDVGAPIHFLDTRPPFADWTMVGCERCMQMHRNFYAREPGVQVDFCPRTRLALRTTEALSGSANGRDEPQDLILTKCCLFEMDVELYADTAIVPWGGNLRHVERALRYLVSRVTGAHPEEPAGGSSPDFRAAVPVAGSHGPAGASTPAMSATANALSDGC
jgi:hypothetical protein